MYNSNFKTDFKLENIYKSVEIAEILKQKTRE